MKSIRKFFICITALVCLLTLVACGETTPKVTLPLITRPAETTRAPETDAGPKHECIWADEETYEAYDTVGDRGEVGYFARHCTVEGCEEIKDAILRPVLLRLDFEGEDTTLEQYLNAADGVSPFLKNDTVYSQGEIRDGVCHIIDNSQVFILCDRLYDEIGEPIRISFDIKLGAGDTQNRDTFFGVGRASQTEAASYYFQFRDTNGRLTYLKNFEFDSINTDMLYEYPLSVGEWYHFDVDIDFEEKRVDIYIGTWVDGTRQTLVKYEHIGTCSGIATSAKNRTDFALRISDQNGIEAFDNLYICLPEE